MWVEGDEWQNVLVTVCKEWQRERGEGAMEWKEDKVAGSVLKEREEEKSLQDSNEENVIKKRGKGGGI